jgi:hypothetical protein
VIANSDRVIDCKQEDWEVRALIMVLFFLAGFTSTQAEDFDLNGLFRSTSPAIEVAAACILEREYRTGSDKHCVYDCSGTKTTTTISPDELCPINITQ